MLDEPVEGLAPISVEEILLVALNLDVCTKLTDRHYIIEQGAIVHCANNEDFMADVAIKDRYLGVGLV